MKNMNFAILVLAVMNLLIFSPALSAKELKGARQIDGEVMAVDYERSRVTVRDMDMNVQRTFNVGKNNILEIKKGSRVKIAVQAGSVWADSIEVIRY
jgi:hypothetical protein